MPVLSEPLPVPSRLMDTLILVSLVLRTTVAWRADMTALMLGKAAIIAAFGAGRQPERQSRGLCANFPTPP
ncbi:MAG: hypothetical protein K0S46_2171 [Moraxellaceae bacterium]|nr:hypothetical protein [Moraxellaceae bacterium]